MSEFLKSIPDAVSRAPDPNQVRGLIVATYHIHGFDGLSRVRLIMRQRMLDAENRSIRAYDMWDGEEDTCYLSEGWDKECAHWHRLMWSWYDLIPTVIPTIR